MSGQTFVEALYSSVATETAVSATVTETILFPDIQLPANYMYQGRTLRFRMHGNYSHVITTPGTFTWRVRWGGVAGIQVVTSAALTPNTAAASTTIPWYLEGEVACRAIGAGTAGSIQATGRLFAADIGAAVNTTPALNFLPAYVSPTSTPPAGVGVDTTVAKALSFTITMSVATAGTLVQVNQAIVESLN